MRAHSRASYGRRAARLVFDRHPGRWEVTQSAGNLPAIAFWRTVLADYRFEQAAYHDPYWGRRSLQRFTA
jgi:predicted acetyltransferase